MFKIKSCSDRNVCLHSTFHLISSWMDSKLVKISYQFFVYLPGLHVKEPSVSYDACFGCGVWI